MEAHYGTLGMERVRVTKSIVFTLQSSALVSLVIAMKLGGINPFPDRQTRFKLFGNIRLYKSFYNRPLLPRAVLKRLHKRRLHIPITKTTVSNYASVNQMKLSPPIFGVA